MSDDGEEVEVLNVEEEDFSSFLPFRLLLQRASLIFSEHEQNEIERQLIETACSESMDTYHQSLFNNNNRLVPTLSPFILQDEVKNMLCHVCLGQIVKGEQVDMLPCKHVFHDECIRGLVTHQHGCCPLCRTQIPVRQLDRSPSPNILEQENKE